MAFFPQIEVIIPLASRLVAKDWLQICRMLKGTLTSVLALPKEFASVSIIGHERPENLPLGDRCGWTAVGWEPPQRDDTAGKLNDKGIKIRLGVQDAFARGAKWVMFVDADDLLSNRLPELCDLDNHDAVCFGNGYSWKVGSDCLQLVPNFHQVCGTSWIMRLSPHFFPTWLGPGTHRVCDLSHSKRNAALIKENARIQIIRCPMAIYCVGHMTAAGFGESFGRRFGSSVFHPFTFGKQLAKRIIRRKRLTPALRKEFSIPTS